MKQLESLRQQNSKLTEAVAIYEDKDKRTTQVLREKEDYIKTLEASSDDLESDKVEALENEVAYLKEIIKKQIEKEQAPLILKLEAQI